MRIAFVHSFYSSRTPSGETGIVHAERDALGRAGFDVELFAAHTDDLEGHPFYPVRAGLRVATGRGRNPLDALRRFRPDVVHVHNLFPNFGRAWVRDVPVPIVHTLHNYRPLCAAGTLFRDGAVCTLCPDGQRWAGVRYACYRNSRLATLPLAWANRDGAAADPLLARAARLVLAEPAIDVYAGSGLDRAKMVAWPNFLPDELDPGPPAAGNERDGFVYVGRLSEEKGVERLVARWPDGHRLDVVGDGPRHDRVRALAAARDSVRFLGRRTRQDVLDIMTRSIGLVVPSLWFEMSPRVYPEALAAGLAVVAFDPNHVARFVRRDGTGHAMTWDDDLLGCLDDLARDKHDLPARSRVVFEERYSEAAHVDRARSLYGDLARGDGSGDPGRWSR